MLSEREREIGNLHRPVRLTWGFIFERSFLKVYDLSLPTRKRAPWAQFWSSVGRPNTVFINHSWLASWLSCHTPPLSFLMLEGHKHLGEGLLALSNTCMTRCPQGSAFAVLFPYCLGICSSIAWPAMSFCSDFCQRTDQCVLIACSHDFLGGQSLYLPARHTDGHILHHRHPEYASSMSESMNRIFHFNSFFSICLRILQTERTHILKQCGTYVCTKSQLRRSVRKSD